MSRLHFQRPRILYFVTIASIPQDSVLAVDITYLLQEACAATDPLSQPHEL